MHGKNLLHLTVGALQAVTLKRKLVSTGPGRQKKKWKE